MPFTRFGPVEIGLILVIILIIYGVGRLPEVGAGMGKGIREFRRGLTGKSSESDKSNQDESS